MKEIFLPTLGWVGNTGMAGDMATPVRPDVKISRFHEATAIVVRWPGHVLESLRLVRREGHGDPLAVSRLAGGELFAGCIEGSPDGLGGLILDARDASGTSRQHEIKAQDMERADAGMFLSQADARPPKLRLRARVSGVGLAVTGVLTWSGACREDFLDQVLVISRPGMEDVSRPIKDLMPTVHTTVQVICEVLAAEADDRRERNLPTDMSRTEQEACLRRAPSLCHVTRAGKVGILDALRRVQSKAGRAIAELCAFGAVSFDYAEAEWLRAIPMLVAQEISSAQLLAWGWVAGRQSCTLATMGLAPGDRIALASPAGGVGMRLQLLEGGMEEDVPQGGAVTAYRTRLMTEQDAAAAKQGRVPTEFDPEDTIGDPTLLEVTRATASSHGPLRDREDAAEPDSADTAATATVVPLQSERPGSDDDDPMIWGGEAAEKDHDPEDILADAAHLARVGTVAPSWMTKVMTISHPDLLARIGLRCSDYWHKNASEGPNAESVRARMIAILVSKALEQQSSDHAPKSRDVFAIDGEDGLEMLQNIYDGLSSAPAAPHDDTPLRQRLQSAAPGLEIEDSEAGRLCALVLAIGVYGPDAGRFLEAVKAGQLEVAIQIARSSLHVPGLNLIG